MKKILLFLTLLSFSASLSAQQTVMIGTTYYGGNQGNGAIFAVPTGSANFAAISSFQLALDGINPDGSVIKAPNGKFYAVTENGGANNAGAIVEFGYGGGAITTKYSFGSSANDGAQPRDGFCLATDGYLYGITQNGGSNGGGCIYKYQPGAGTITILYNFPVVYGTHPTSRMIQAGNGVFYGVTTADGSYSAGALFSYELGVGFSPIHYFYPSTDGNNPTGLVQASNGKLYGMTTAGGSGSYGGIYSYDIGLSFYSSLLTNFTSGNGITPFGALVEGTPGHLFGLASSGGTNNFGSIFDYDFTSNALSQAYAFTGAGTFGYTPEGTLTKSAYNGLLYGTTNDGGANSKGVVFEFNPSTTAYNKLVDFGGANGENPMHTQLFEYLPLTTTGSGTNATCNGLANGSATVTATGGMGPYTYAWSPSGGTSNIASSLSAGNYTCQVTDAIGAVKNQTVTITEPSVLGSGVNSQTDPTCFGASNGSVTVLSFGGTPPYIYNWTPSGGTLATASSLPAGSYTCTTMDANGCSVQAGVTLTQPTALNVIPSSTDVSCFGGTNGTAYMSVSGGTPLYSYSWAPSGGIAPTETNLAGGTYTCTITDNNGCVSTNTVIVNEPAMLNATASQIVVACQGLNNSAAYASVSGGTPPYAYSWTSGGSTNTENGLAPGSYTCSVTDVNSCPATASVTIVENASTDLNGNITAATLTITSGTVYVFKQQSTLNGIDTVAFTPIFSGAPNYYSFPGLTAGDYYVKVVPDLVSYPTAVPTYYGDVFQWDSSTVVHHGCSVIDNADIHVIELLPPGGTGFVSGFVIEGLGYQGLRVFHDGGNHPVLPCVPGGPLKGVDVKLGKNPGGGIQARVMTDTSGYFEFENVPDGDYRIYVDIPNLPMDSLREVTISGGDSTIQNNYIADSMMIYVDTAQFVGIYSSAKQYDNKFSIYPNPTQNVLNLQFTTVKESEEIAIEITNAAGIRVYAVKQQRFAKGDNNIILNAGELDLAAGVYFVSLVNGSQRSTQRIVVIE
jgi:uncharacterized repeat protein (TIGR03803 family)